MRTALIAVVVVGACFIVVPAVFERVAPRRLVNAYQRLANPLYRPAAGIVPGWAVIETIGRRTGIPRQVPVGGGLRGGSFWFVAGNAGHSQFVKNIAANVSVRVRVHGRWHTGTARLLPEDHPRRRLLRLNPINGLFILIAGRDLMTIRVDLNHR